MKKDYYIALDIGTNSVGYAVINSDNELLTFKKKNMWGARIFQAGNTSKERRVQRNTRRRYHRRRERIKLLQSFFLPYIEVLDDSFFLRLQEGYLWREDKSVSTRHILFSDENYTDKEFYSEYATIYHLRKELMDSDEKYDLRKVYLALHHIIKYRGHFLFAGKSIAQVTGAVGEILSNLFLEILEKNNIDLCGDEYREKVVDILSKSGSTKKEKQEEIIRTLLLKCKDKEYITELVKAILGYKFKWCVVFREKMLVNELGKELDISLADSKFDEQESALMEQLEDKSIILELIKKVHNWIILKNIKKGYDTLSEAMIGKYEKHKKDLRLLQKIYKDNIRERYEGFFNEVNDENKKNYPNYIRNRKKCTQEELYKQIRKDVKGLVGCDVEYVLKEMDEGAFLPLQVSKENSTIPYQLNLIELQRIIEKQGKYYPFLLENKEKIESIMTFRIPYYVGPLVKNSNFAWLTRTDEKIYPWNFEEVVDIDQTAEDFIKRMRNYCTYLPGEMVLPRYSLLYTKYLLFDELNRIRINGYLINSADKERMFRELFLKKKRVREKDFIEYLNKINYAKIGHNLYIIEGYHKEKEFAASLSSWIDFQNLFGEINEYNFSMIEQLIEWISIFEDKTILRRKIETSEYKDKITVAQLAKILDFSYKGWSRFSKKLLNGIFIETEAMEKKTIMDVLEQTNRNFMQIITDSKLGFKEVIEKYNVVDISGDITMEQIQEIQGSPAIKRGVWQTVRIVQELISIMGYEPRGIYLEFARNEGKKEVTSTRQKFLNKGYALLKKEAMEFNNEAGENLSLKKYTERLDSEKLYLYFIQNGKCMYSGEKLEIDMLSQYEVDHILPQAYIVDDSIENKALVCKMENQYKGDSLFLKESIRCKQKEYWEKLYRCGLISKKKYTNLMRADISDVEGRSFINRQLVETRQIAKHVAVLFQCAYPNTQISTIKAELISNFRRKYDIVKLRELNHFHHAHDALIM